MQKKQEKNAKQENAKILEKNKTFQENKNSEIAKTSVIAKDREYAFQANEISRSIYTCSMLARKIISFSSSIVEVGMRALEGEPETLIKVWTAKFSINDFIKKFGLVNSGGNYESIRAAIFECQKAVITLKRGKGFKSFNWFYSVDFSPENDSVEMTFSPDVGSAIYNFKTGYTAMRFKMIGRFKSLYSFRFYEIAISYQGNKGKNGNKKGQWFFDYSLDDLKKIMGLEKKAYEGRNNTFIEKVIKKPIEELNKSNKEFKIDFEKIKDGRYIIGFHFVCTELVNKIPQIEISMNDDPEKKLENQILDSEIAFFEKYTKELEEISKELQNDKSKSYTNFALFVETKTELTKRHQEEWDKIHSGE